MDDNYDLKTIDPSYKNKNRRIIDEIEDLGFVEYNSSDKSISSAFLPSSLLKNQKSKKEIAAEDESNADAWFKDMIDQSTFKIEKSGKASSAYFNLINGGKKRKKKKYKDKKDNSIDFKSEFEPEMNLYKNLLIEQNKFTDSLQREYNQIKSTKSSARGLNKQLTDLVENITSARQLSMQLVEKNVNAKKLIAELNMKQNKDINNTDGNNAMEFGANYLRQIIDNKNMINGVNNDITISEDMTDDEMFNTVANSLGDIDRAEEVERMLKYENENVSIYVELGDDIQGTTGVTDYTFIAMNENGDVINDYPLPIKTSLNINESIGIATDEYGQKYHILNNNIEDEEEDDIDKYFANL